MDNHPTRKSNSQVWLGLFFLIVGTGLILQHLDTSLPWWLFSWKTFLIGLGLFIGIRNEFRGGSWLIMMLIGGAFLFNDIYPELSLHEYAWPVVIIITGVWLIIRPRNYRKFREEYWTRPRETPPAGSSDDFIDSTSVFGGVRKTILSKDFKGGDIVSFLGGIELNLSQADITGRVELEVTVVMGGAKLIVPANWDIKSELVTVLGGIDDKRAIQPGAIEKDKVLVLKGTALMGGIDIRNF